jgi:cytochrome c biogenesis protein CcmG, thiol:disulfide interchange protein DsbE
MTPPDDDREIIDREPDDGPATGTGSDDRSAGRPKTLRLIALAVGVVLVLFVALLATRHPSEERFGPNQLLGRAVPAVSGTTMNGDTVSIDTLRGKWVVVNFFATWCTRCLFEHPELKAFREEHRATGKAEVVSIAFDDSPDNLREFFQRNGGDWPVIINDDRRSAIDFGVTGVPESFVVAPNGRVVSHFTGVTAAGLDQVIAEAEAADGGSAGPTVPGASPDGR